jgi:hypothetical protein
MHRRLRSGQRQLGRGDIGAPSHALAAENRGGEGLLLQSGGDTPLNLPGSGNHELGELLQTTSKVILAQADKSRAKAVKGCGCSIKPFSVPASALRLPSQRSSLMTQEA